MTKPLHPTAESIKAGQTIYLLCFDWASPEGTHHVRPITITGKSEPSVKEGEFIEFAPINWLQNKMRMPGYATDPYYPLKYSLFHSKRKALSRMKQMQQGGW